MTLSFLADENISPETADYLENLGYPCHSLRREGPWRLLGCHDRAPGAKELDRTLRDCLSRLSRASRPVLMPGARKDFANTELEDRA
jgi:hypothetical protein